MSTKGAKQQELLHDWYTYQDVSHGLKYYYLAMKKHIF